MYDGKGYVPVSINANHRRASFLLARWEKRTDTHLSQIVCIGHDTPPG
jgi:hypothetical protein